MIPVCALPSIPGVRLSLQRRRLICTNFQCLIHLFLVANKYLRLPWSVALVETVLFSYCMHFLEGDSWNRTLQACQAWSLGDKCGSEVSS